MAETMAMFPVTPAGLAQAHLGSTLIDKLFLFLLNTCCFWPFTAENQPSVAIGFSFFGLIRKGLIIPYNYTCVGFWKSEF
jgi:hypothetical protein